MTGRKLKTGRFKFSLGQIILAALLFISIIYFTVNLFISSYLENKLNTIDIPLNKFQFSFHKLKVNVFTGSATAKGIHILSLSPGSNSTVDFKTETVSLSGISFLDLIFRHRINIEQIRLEGTQIGIKEVTDYLKRKSPAKPFTLYELIQNHYSTLTIGKFMIVNGEIQMNKGDGHSLYLDSRSFNLTLDNISTDSISAAKGEVFELGNASFYTREIKGIIENDLYHLDIHSISFNSRDSLFTVDSVMVNPTVDKLLFSQKAGKRIDCLNVLLEHLQFHLATFRNMVEQHALLVDTLIIKYAYVTDYINKNAPLRPNKFILHHDFLYSLPFNIDVHYTRLDNADIRYDELGEGNQVPGYVTFNKLKGTLTEFSNISKQNTMKLTLSGYVMGMAQARIRILFPLAKNEFYANGNSGPFDFKIINPILKNVGGLQIKSGTSEGISISCLANNTGATGNMTFIYSDLKVSLPMRDGNDHIRLWHPLKSFITNDMMVFRDNPERNKPRVGKIECVRDPTNSFISYLWQLTSFGLEASVGIKERLLDLLIH